jgi:L-asparaginase/Glu-tRNA(Gln) amidotransferase subunit D
MASRILLLYTGGTIGMQDSPSGLIPASGLLPRLLAQREYTSYTLDIVEYDELIDSSAITLSHWNRIIDDIVSRACDFDGVVLVHGTDTLAYSASVLAFALQGLGKPVVLTGAQWPLLRPGSDGWQNLGDALLAASQTDLHEVVIAFDRVLLRGCQARKVDAQGFHGFDSPNAPVLAEFGAQPLWHRQRWRSAASSFTPAKLDPAARVAAFFLTPGCGAALIGQTLQQQPLDGALLLSYGNGNTPADPGLLAGVRQLVAAGGQVLNLTQAQHGAVEPGVYAASQALLLAGALPGRDMTPEAALAKLTWLCSLPLDKETRRALCDRCLVGEFSQMDSL